MLMADLAAMKAAPHAAQDTERVTVFRSQLVSLLQIAYRGTQNAPNEAAALRFAQQAADRLVATAARNRKD